MFGIIAKRNMYSCSIARRSIRGCMSYNHYPVCRLLARDFCATEGKFHWREPQRPIATSERKLRHKKKISKRKPRDNSSRMPENYSKVKKEWNPKQHDDQSNEKIKSIFLHLGNLLASYQEKLFDGIDQKVVEEEKRGRDHKHDIVEDTFSQLKYLNDMCQDGNSLKIDWSRIEETESIFKHICRAMQNAVTRTTSLQDSPVYLAEKLLKLFLDFRYDRASIVRRFKPEEQPKSLTSSSSTWFSDFFVFSPEKREKETQQVAVIAHEDSSFAPRARHLNDIMIRVFHDVPKDVTKSSVLSERADRLISLLKRSPDSLTSIKNLQYVLRAQAAVGTLDRADEAQRIWRESLADFSSLELFIEVLRAYELASFREKKLQPRSKAVFEVEKLVLQGEWNHTRNHLGSNTRKPFEIALKVLSGAPIKIVPDCCERAENLVMKCFGEKPFAEMFVSIDETSTKNLKLISVSDMQLLRHLVVLYTSQQDSRRLKQGMQILRYLELQHEAAQNNKRILGRTRKEKNFAHKYADSLSQAQWLEIYRAMIIGIRNYTFSSKCKDSKRTSDSLDIINLAMYASGLLNRMNAVGASPDSDFFNRLLKIWLRVKSSKSGEYAEDILSRMQIREVLDPSVQVTEDTYASVIHCWHEAAIAGHPEAAERASYLLRSMEVQSGVRELPKGDDLSEVEEEIHDAVYNKSVRPRTSTYNDILAVCGHSRQGPMKENAVDEALDVHHRLLDAGSEPTSVTYLSLFKCLNKNLHKDSPRRILAGKDILLSAKTSGIVFDPSVVKALKEVDSSLHREYLKELNSTLSTE